MDYSNYIRNKQYCNNCIAGPQGPQGPEGPQGPQGPEGPSYPTMNALIFYEDISLDPQGGSEDISLATYGVLDTSYNGVSRFIQPDGTITFSDISYCTNCMVEIYAHSDAEAGSTGTANYVKIDLSGLTVEPNSLSIIDIDTRSVEKGSETHLSFGPSTYRLVNTTSAQVNKCIHFNNTYKLRISVGREYTLRELKLVMKIINYDV